MAGLAPHAGHAQVVGITGSPGVGKSTSTAALVGELRARQARRRAGRGPVVAVLRRRAARRPGADAGPRASTASVYIRSMASRGHLGGLAWTTPQALRVLDAAGCDVILVETVGRRPERGRDRRRSPTPRWCCSRPGWATASRPPRRASWRSATSTSINKADRDGADQVRRDLRSMLGAGRAAARATGDRRSSRPSPPRARASTRWSPRSTGTARGSSPPASSSAGAPAGPATRSRRSRSPRCARGGATCTAAAELDGLAAAVVAGESDPYAAADALLEDM